MDDDMLQLALTESAKLLPYVMTSRKAIRLYLKVSLGGILVIVIAVLIPLQGMSRPMVKCSG